MAGPDPSSDLDGLAAAHICLIGLRGAGKTTVGRLLAADLRRPFHDLDDLALRRLGVISVREVFAERGEAAWRQAEADAIDACLAAPLAPSVLALGGGSVMVERVLRSLEAARAASRCVIVLLDIAPADAAERLEVDPGDRPVLTAGGADRVQPSVVSELAALHAARIDRYRALAQVTVPSGGSSARAIAHAVCDALAGLR